ncbi:integral membrane protein [Colletotrichum zoysiae]|uniref:Integral membrane protein n=1 Tax=Colletotrichum zoysiae TaxID=1216348 RepID=A0AAD9HGD2_9PEZI|nr:integral membrane protein [Colletotrichum zoysiae]
MITEYVDGDSQLTQYELMAIAALATAGIYNAAEIYVFIFATFRRRQGRYFWSMVVADSGILVNAVALLVHHLGRSVGGGGGASFVPGALALPGWVAMVTGQSLVLWSRLHLVVYNRRWIRSVLVLIVADACVLHVPMAVVWGLTMAAPPPERDAWLRRFALYEKVAIVVFSLQETLITGIFARQGFLNLKPLFAFKTRTARLVCVYLLSLFVIVFLLDVGLVLLDYTNHAVFQTTSKPFVYSVKLKVEFVVLNKLLAFTKMNLCDCHHLDDTSRGYSNSKGVRTTDTTTTAIGLTKAQREGHGNNVLEAVPDMERPDHIFDGSSVLDRGKQNLG